MKVSIASDHAGFRLKEAVLPSLESDGHEVIDLGANSEQPVDYPDYAMKIATVILSGKVERDIFICGSGVGGCVAANKVPGVRAALCADAETARRARLWNRANVLCLSLRGTSEAMASEILEVWFATAYRPNPEDDACLDQVRRLEDDYRKTGPWTE